MFARVRSMGLAGGGAIALTVALSGVVAAATVLTALSAPTTTTEPTTTVVDTATFQDLDGNGVDDACQTDPVVADPVAAASAEAAVDLNGDGTISVSEAAQSDRTGGKNCNHGGYVSGVARGTCADTGSTEDPAAGTDETDGTETSDSTDGTDGSEQGDDAATTDATTTDTACADTATDTPATCDTSTTDGTTTDATTDSTTDGATTPTDTSPNAHGKAVADVAQSDAVGGKNCNHGGAVSEVAKNHDAARDARAAAKAAREAARDARRAEREAARSGKHHGRPG